MSSSVANWRFRFGFVVMVAACAIFPAPLRGQIVQRQVGGISISPDGLLSSQQVDETHQLRQARMLALQPIAPDLQGRSALRKVSLHMLESVLAENRKTGQPIRDEVKYLAGLQRIKYVFVYPQQQDIVLAGPGEDWRIDEQGEVVGVSSGNPVLLLDDL